MKDLTEALHAGYADFAASRSDVILIALVYPVLGLILLTTGLSMNLLPLLFPMIAGFAMLGPVAAIGLYEISRLREAGENPDWVDAFGVLRAPAFFSVVMLGLYLAALFVFWLLTAQAIYDRTMGPGIPASLAGFISDTLTTPAGWLMIFIGFGTGAIFALAALATSLVSFPSLLDRGVSLQQAVSTSFRVLHRSPGVTLLWSAIAGGLLMLAALPLLLGLLFILPVLGHATWHLYRRAVQ